MGFSLPNPKKVLKKGISVLKSPTRTLTAAFTAGLSELTGLGDRISNSQWSRYTDAIGYAATAAALPFAMGLGGTTALAAGGFAGTQYLGYKQAQDAQNAQQQAQARAEANAIAAQRESEIMRKQALLASQKSMQARKSAAGAIVNKLRNTNVSLLGEDEEKLGG